MDKSGGGDGAQRAASGSPGSSASGSGAPEASASGRVSGASVAPRVPRARQAPGASAVAGASCAPDPSSARDAAEDSLTRLESLLAAAVRAGPIDADAEERAIAAFRAARDGAGRRSSRTRRRDDWRPRGWRGSRRLLRAVVGALLASLTLGGMAMASMGVLGTSSQGKEYSERLRPQQTAREPTAAAESAAAPSSSVGGTSTPGSVPAGSRGRDKAAGVKNGKALCHAYAAVKGRGQVPDATAWRRLVDAAGGEASVHAYCEQQMASGKGGAKKKTTGSTAADGGAGSSGKAARETAEAAKGGAVADRKSRGRRGGSATAESGAATAAGAGPVRGWPAAGRAGSRPG